MILYHAITPKKALKYKKGFILPPVRGFSTLEGAKFWAKKVNRTLIYELNCDNTHKLPDHHNKYGKAYWNDGIVYNPKLILEL